MTARLFCHFGRALSGLDPLATNILRHLADRSPPGTLFSHMRDEFLNAETEAMSWDECVSAVVAAVRENTRAPIVERQDSRAELSVEAILRTMREIAESVGRPMEDRPEQRRMIDTIAEAFAAKRNTVIEAPTGIGKTFAYLLPALAASLPRGERVMVSTHTKILQDQLLDRDLPFLRDVFEAAGIPRSSWSVAKLK